MVRIIAGLLFGVGLAVVVAWWRHAYDRRLITREIEWAGGVVDDITVHMRPVRSEYEVTYRDSDGTRHVGFCITRVSTVYWSSDQKS